MRAAYYEANGPAREVLRVGEIETPSPGPREVRVRLRTSGVNPTDWKTRGGTVRKIAFPRVIPHSDGAGEIDAVGEGVPAGRVGERVWIWNGAWKRPFGTAAEYIAVPERQAVPLPEKASFDAGACLGIPALTAYHAITIDGPVTGQTLLIAGGAGAVGHYAIQFAKAKGATVVTTVSSAEKASIARAAGADHVINYKSEDVGTRVNELTGGAGADRVIEVDISANAKLLPSVLRPRGTVVIYGTAQPEATIPSSFLLTNTITLKYFLVYELGWDERRAAIDAITQMLEQDRLAHNLGPSFALDQVVDAHEAVESGAVGNVVLRIG